jgi:hypothetical protein
MRSLEDKTAIYLVFKTLSEDILIVDVYHVDLCNVIVDCFSLQKSSNFGTSHVILNMRRFTFVHLCLNSWSTISCYNHTCSGLEASLRCRLSKTHIWLGKPQGAGILGGEGMGRGWKWGDQFTSNLGPRWTGSYHSKKGSK